MRSKLVTFCREPLVHFLVIGAGLFLVWVAVGDQTPGPSTRIILAPTTVERLAEVFRKTRLRPPTAEELAGLVEQEIEEEVLYREAMAMGLDRDDLIIRRRLCIKMEFLADDLAALETPSDEHLTAFLQKHADKFGAEKLTTFTQIFVNPAERGANSGAEVERLLKLLNGASPPDWRKLGDPLPLANECEKNSEAEIARVFGREFPEKLAALPVGQWAGPVESGYGLHLVLVRARTLGRTPALDEVREAVVREWRAARRQEKTAELRRHLRAKYHVTIDWPEWARDAATIAAAVPKGSP